MHSPFTYVQALASSRSRSLDTVGVFERSDVLVVVVADGGGGLRSGGAASRCLVSVVGAAVTDPGLSLEDTRSWIDVFRASDTALAANAAGETTGIVVALGPRGVVGASVGHSEAWVVTPTSVDDLTIGKQAKQRLGGSQIIPTTFERAALRGILIIASDGLFRYASSDAIAGIVRNNGMAAAAEHLIDLVRFRSGKVADDVSVVLVCGDAVRAHPA